MPSIAAAVALGPKPGIVKTLAELPAFYRPGRLLPARTARFWPTPHRSAGWRRLDDLGVLDRLSEKGVYVAYTFNKQWRVCFKWPADSDGPFDVEITDYH